MAGFVKLAVAGAGKTTWLGTAINPEARNILITFTNQNVNNLKAKVKKANNGRIPEKTIILTYTKFLYYWLIKPCESLYVVKSGEKIDGFGMSINEPPQLDRHKLNNGYVKNTYRRHYIDSNNKYYVSRMSELFIKQSASVKNNVRNYLGKFIDNIYIDEFQDFVGNDYKLIMELIKGKGYITHMVGDYYQSLVTDSSSRGMNSTNPYKNGNYSSFIEKLKKEKIKVDTEQLKKSWRCPFLTCNFISKRLGILIQAINDDLEYGVKTIENRGEAVKVLQNDNIVKLLYHSRIKGFEMASAAREKYVTTGEVDYIGQLLTHQTHFSKEDLEKIPAGLYRDGVQYYGDTHYHPNAQSRYTTMSLLGLMTFDVENQAELLTQPLLMMTGDVSDTRYMTDDFFKKATGIDDKQVVYIKGANHIETYWKPEYVQEEAQHLIDFFNQKLGE